MKVGVPTLELPLHRFTEWAKKYGGIYTLKRFTNTTIIVSDPSIIKELFDKKSSIYSHRPVSHVGDLITQGDHLLLMQYGDDWRRIRKLIHQHFMEAMCERQHVHLQNAEATQLMHDFLVAPERHMEHPKRYSNSITNSLGESMYLKFETHPTRFLTDPYVSIRDKDEDHREQLHEPPIFAHGRVERDPRAWGHATCRLLSGPQVGTRDFHEQVEVKSCPRG